MDVRFAGRVDRAMRVPMVLVIYVRMSMAYEFMNVLLFVMLRHVQPHAGSHQGACNDDPV